MYSWRADAHIHTHTHTLPTKTHAYIFIYRYICVELPRLWRSSVLYAVLIFYSPSFDSISIQNQKLSMEPSLKSERQIYNVGERGER